MLRWCFLHETREKETFLVENLRDSLRPVLRRENCATSRSYRGSSIPAQQPGGRWPLQERPVRPEQFKVEKIADFLAPWVPGCTLCFIFFSRQEHLPWAEGAGPFVSGCKSLRAPDVEGGRNIFQLTPSGFG